MSMLRGNRLMDFLLARIPVLGIMYSVVLMTVCFYVLIHRDSIMGEPNLPTLPAPYSDDDCSHFPAGMTPLIIAVTFSGIQLNPDYAGYPDPPNGTYFYTQEPGTGNPCVWYRRPGEALHGGFYAGPTGYTWFYFEDGAIWAFWNVGGSWATIVQNGFQDPYNDIYYGGQASIDLTAQGNRDNPLYELYPVEAAKLEVLLNEPDKSMLRVVNNVDGTNIKALIEHE